MSRFETFVDSKKRRVPQLPKFFSLVGYDPFRFPHVFNYFILEGYVVYVQKNRYGYSVVTDGWICGDNCYSCTFESLLPSVFKCGLSHLRSLEVFSDVCGILQKCFFFNFVKRPRYEYVIECAEKIAYENNSPADAEKIILDNFGDKELFDELP